jgi:hypothetical protein
VNSSWPYAITSSARSGFDWDSKTRRLRGLDSHRPAWREANRGHISLEQMKVVSAIERCRIVVAGDGEGALRDEFHHLVVDTAPVLPIGHRLGQPGAHAQHAYHSRVGPHTLNDRTNSVQR